MSHKDFLLFRLWGIAYTQRIMTLLALERDEDGYAILKVPVDDATLVWLERLGVVRGYEASLIAAAVLRDVREDDQAEHPRDSDISLQ